MLDQIISLLISLYAPALLTALVGLVVYEVRKIAPPVRAAVTTWTKTHLDAHEQAVLTSLVTQAVTAAEQIATNPDVKAAAGYKLAYALNTVKKGAARYGISVDDAALRSMVESAVYQEFNWGTKPKAPEKVEAPVPALPSLPTGPAGYSPESKSEPLRDVDYPLTIPWK